MHNKQAGATLQLLTHAGEQRWAPSEAGVTPGTAAGGVLLAQVAPRAELSSPAVNGVGGNCSRDDEGCPRRSAITSLCGGSVERSPALSALIYSLIGEVSRAVNISKRAAPPIKVRPLICHRRIPACPYRSISCLSL